jgi:hypothetical protein
VHAERRRGRQRSRILYWFRTPPGVRVGRSALDENAIRLIEESNPGLEFDWTRILKGEGAVAPPEARPRPEYQERRARPRGPRDRGSALPPPAPARERGLQAPPPVDAAPELVPEPIVTPAEAALVEPDVPLGPEGPLTEPAAAPEATAAQARLGSEGLQRLRARHAEVLARISEKIADPLRREELKAQAERLNPDTWVTDDEVVAGLEQYEAVFESLRGIVGRRRRRRKRRGGARPGGETAGQPGETEAEDGEHDRGEADDDEGPL